MIPLLYHHILTDTVTRNKGRKTSPKTIFIVVDKHRPQVKYNEIMAFLKNIFKTMVVVLVTATAVQAQPWLDETIRAKFKAEIEFVESELGIDYSALAPSPFAQLLSQGEVEWLKNAQGTFGDKTATLWKKRLLPEIVSGLVSETTIQNMRDFTPGVLLGLAYALDPDDPKYGQLYAQGLLMVEEQQKIWDEFFQAVSDGVVKN